MWFFDTVWSNHEYWYCVFKDQSWARMKNRKLALAFESFKRNAIPYVQRQERVAVHVSEPDLLPCSQTAFTLHQPTVQHAQVRQHRSESVDFISLKITFTFLHLSIPHVLALKNCLAPLWALNSSTEFSHASSCFLRLWWWCFYLKWIFLKLGGLAFLESVRLPFFFLLLLPFLA